MPPLPLFHQFHLDKDALPRMSSHARPPTHFLTAPESVEHPHCRPKRLWNSSDPGKRSVKNLGLCPWGIFFFSIFSLWRAVCVFPTQVKWSICINMILLEGVLRFPIIPRNKITAPVSPSVEVFSHFRELLTAT